MWEQFLGHLNCLKAIGRLTDYSESYLIVQCCDGKVAPFVKIIDHENVDCQREAPLPRIKLPAHV